MFSIYAINIITIMVRTISTNRYRYGNTHRYSLPKEKRFAIEEKDEKMITIKTQIIL